MGLEEYQAPKGAYYQPALVARYGDPGEAEAAIGLLREAGFTSRDIQVSQEDAGVTVIVSQPTPGIMEEARRILVGSGAIDVHPYGTDRDTH